MWSSPISVPSVLDRSLLEAIMQRLFSCNPSSLLSNAEYLYQDLFIVFVLAVTLGSTPAATHLTRKRPSGRLLSPYNLSVCGGFIICTVSFIHETEFCPSGRFHTRSDDGHCSLENISPKRSYVSLTALAVCSTVRGVSPSYRPALV